MEEKLLDLKNLGKTSVQWLHASGIHNVADLRRMGAVQAFRAVRLRGFSTSMALLYAIEGALRGQAWSELPAEHKALLKHEFDTLPIQPKRPQ